MLWQQEPLSQDHEFKYKWCLGNTCCGIKSPSAKAMSLSTTGALVIHAVVSRAPLAKTMSLSTTGARVIHAVVSRAL